MPPFHLYRWTFCLLLCSILNAVHCVEKEVTISVDPRKEDCYFQSAKKGETIDIEYQVIDGGHGDLDITFHLADPTGRILIADFKKSENNHRADAVMDGDYKFCFDNTFSSYNTKTIFFELIIENEDDDQWGNGDIDLQGIRPEEVYELKVEDIQEIINSVRNQLTKAQQLQALLKSTEARDRNVAEENYFKVNTYSMFQIGIMIIVGIIQVIMVRSLFDDKSKVHNIWKNLDSKR